MSSAAAVAQWPLALLSPRFGSGSAASGFGVILATVRFDPLHYMVGVLTVCLLCQDCC